MKNRELNDKELEQAAGGHADHAQVQLFTGSVQSASGASGGAFQLGDSASSASGSLDSRPRLK